MLSSKVVSERLRTMLRYKLVWRYPQRGEPETIEYRLTPLGKRILGMLDVIDQIDLEQRTKQNSLHEELKMYPEGPPRLVDETTRSTDLPTSPSTKPDL